MSQRAPHAGNIITPPTPRCGSHSTRSAGRLTSIALIAYALSLAVLVAGVFIEYVTSPLEIDTRPVGSGLRDIPPECWAAPSLYDCANYLEPQ